VDIKDDITMGTKCHPAVAISSKKYNDCRVSIEFENLDCMKSSIVLRSQDDGSGVICEIDYRNKEINIGECITKSYIIFGLDKLKKIHTYKFTDKISDTIVLDVVARSEGFDWYLDGYHFFTTVFDNYIDEGRIALVSKDGELCVKNIKIFELEAEKNFLLNKRK
jgi:hypothetical protein